MGQRDREVTPHLHSPSPSQEWLRLLSLGSHSDHSGLGNASGNPCAVQERNQLSAAQPAFPKPRHSWHHQSCPGSPPPGTSPSPAHGSHTPSAALPGPCESRTLFEPHILTGNMYSTAVFFSPQHQAALAIKQIHTKKDLGQAYNQKKAICSLQSTQNFLKSHHLHSKDIKGLQRREDVLSQLMYSPTPLPAAPSK